MSARVNANNIITTNRGDSFKFPIQLNIGTIINPIWYDMVDGDYVYLGVTTNYDKALELKEQYENDNIHIYIRSDYVENSETLFKLKEYDSKLEKDNVESVMKEIFENSELNL